MGKAPRGWYEIELSLDIGSGRDERFEAIGRRRVKLLALDTSTNYAAVALGLSDHSILFTDPDPTQRHGRGLLPAVQELLRQAGLSVMDLDGFAVGLGPGSYTGLRVGVTAIKTLAFATGRPLVGLESYDVIAANAPVDVLRVSVVGDAQRGDLFSAEFSRARPGEPLLREGPTRVEPITAWRARLDPSTLVLGPALEPPAKLLVDVPGPADPSNNRPDGVRLIALARQTLASGRRDEPWLLEPIYLRRSAAEDLWERKGAS
jgi:tRNA threonylcarbamoyladenosine biosynthesis protein TsaB